MDNSIIQQTSETESMVLVSLMLCLWLGLAFPSLCASHL
ncbi:unnamed protein product [Brassica oleracea var. botrytis]